MQNRHRVIILRGSPRVSWMLKSIYDKHSDVSVSVDTMRVKCIPKSVLKYNPSSPVFLYGLGMTPEFYEQEGINELLQEHPHINYIGHDRPTWNNDRSRL